MWKLTPIFLILNSVFGVQKLDSRIDPLVETKLGLIRGLRSENGQFASFLGIPYAVVDVENPFDQSVPHPGFEEAFNAYDSSVLCPQVTFRGEVSGDLQCLNLNIYVPNAASSQNKLPVMVYVHGGAFILGNGAGIGTPTNLLDKNVIVISFNYRLGIYGFMCTESAKAPGNIGLRDQLLALRWINEHIEAFGGDKTKITVFGESAGAMSIYLHIISPYEKLFDRAIMQSGVATSPWSYVDIDNTVPIRISAELGFVTEDVDEAIDFIAKANVHLAIAAARKIESNSQYSGEPLTKACVEKEFEGFERFVPVNPNVALSDKAKSIEVITGHTQQELIFKHGTVTAEFYENYSFKDLLSFGFNVDGFDDMIDVVRHFYIGDDAPNESLEVEITNFASDFIFNHPTERAVELLLKSDAKAIYRYIFSYVGSLNTAASVNSSMVATSHAEEMFYLFGNLVVFRNILNAEDLLTVDRLATLWTNFAKYGDPVPETTDLLPVKWEPVSEESIPYLNIDKDLKLESRPFHERMAFWDLFYKVNEGKTKWADSD